MRAVLKRKARKVISLLLVLTMLASMPGLAALAAGDEGQTTTGQPELKLWYNQPASETSRRGDVGAGVPTTDDDIWQKNTLPIGNGDLGANIYGEIAVERLTLNEKTLWTGGPSESRPNYIGGNLENKGKNGEQLKKVQQLFLAGKISEGESAAGQLVGEDRGNYGYYSPWGELNIAHDDMAPQMIALDYAAKPGAPVNGSGTTYLNTDKFAFSSNWYGWNDGDGSHKGSAKAETNTANAYFTYSFTVPEGKSGTLELYSDTTGGGGTFTLEFTQKPSGYTQNAVDATAGGLFKSFTGLVPGDYTLKGTCKSGKVDMDYVKLSAVPANIEITNYKRWLSLDNALAGVEFTADGVNYTREYFVSHADNVLVAHLTASSSANFTVTLPKKMNTAATTVAEGTDTLKLCGQLSDNQEKFASFLKAVPSAGTTVNAIGDHISVTGTEVTLYFSAATDYKAVYPTYRNGETDAQLAARVKGVVDAAANRGYTAVRGDHLTDYHSLYNRMTLDVGQTDTAKPTDELILAYQNGTATVGEQRLLEVMIFQYGRYLTIASSREDSILPANLQGVWNNRASPPWNSDYHTNVNLQMNYWPTYVTNLAECGDSLVRFMESLREPGRVTAKIYAGIESTAENPENGFMAHTQTTPYGYTTPGWSFDWGWSPAAIAWLMMNVWEYYEYTGDVEYMRNYIYPMMREYTRFYDQFLIDKTSGLNADKLTSANKNVVLASVPAYSPETGPRTAGNTYEHSIIWQLYDDTITAAELLGVDTDRIGDAETPGTWAYNRDHLEGPIEVGASGQVKEWFHEVEFNKDADGNSLGEGFTHRHLSHMIGLFPGDLIQTDEEWYEAARVSMNNRNDVNTGWSMAHRVACWARLRDGNHGHKVLSLMIKNNKFYNNLWDTHAPFQIDGNFGYTAGAAELLMQSNMGFIDLLPALPDAWATGSYEGLLARGNFEVDAAWANKLLTRAAITSKNGGECTVAYPNISQAKVTDASGSNLIEFEIVDNDKIRFNTAKGATYVITDIPAHGVSVVEGAEALRTGDDTVVVRWTAEDGKSYQVYRQIDGGEILPVGSPVEGGSYEDTTAYEALGTLKYYFAVDDNAVTTTPVTVQDLRNMGRVDDQYSLDGTDSNGTPIVYTGTWGTHNKNSGDYKTTCRFVEAGDINGQTATLTFRGTGIEVRGCSYGTKFYLSIDGGAPQEIDAGSKSDRQSLLGKIEGLEFGIHKVVLTLKSGKIDFDGFNVLGGGTPVNPDEPDTLEISTVGGVEKLWDAGETVTFTSNITEGVTWTATSNVTHATTCNYPEHKFSWNAATQTLTAGRTDEVITVTATKGSKTASKRITITPKTTVTIVEDNDSAVNRTGGIIWTGEATRHHGGSKADNPDKITFTFTGTGIGVFAPKWRNGGGVKITLDGVVKKGENNSEFSVYVNADTGYDQSEIAKFTDLENKQHTIVLEKLSIQGQGNQLALDFFEVYAPNPNAPTVNMDALKEAVAACAELNPDSYTADSWTALETALNAASGLLNGSNPGATAQDVTNAVNAINSAKEALVAKPLGAPANLVVAQVGGTSVTLKWDAVAGASSYVITVGGKTYETDKTAYQVTDLTSAASYSFSVNSKNDAGLSAAVATVSATTLDTVAPSTPTGLAYSSGVLSWTASTDNKAVTGYKVYVNGELNSDESTDLSRTLNLSESAQHSIRVIAVDAAGNESTPATLVIAPTHTVSVTNATIEGGKTKFKVGEAVTVTAIVPTGHILTRWDATGVTLETGTTETTLYFAMPDSDVSLTANIEARSWDVTANLTNLTIAGLPSTVSHGGNLSATLNAPSPYKRPATIVVTVGGTVKQSPYVEYNSVTGAITIKEITGDVVITAENAIQTPAGDAFTSADPFGLPTAIGETTKLQAEYMELTGSGLTAQTGPGFGNKHISGFVNGTSLKLYYNAPVAGTYNMTLNYRSGRNTNNLHTLAWSGDQVTAYEMQGIPSTLEGSTGVYQSHNFQFTVNEAGPGEVTFTTNSTNDGPELDWATFTLTSATIKDITSITVTPETKTLYTNADDPDHRIELTATTDPTDANDTIVWSSSNPDVAYVEQDGTVVARSNGTTTITATARKDASVTASVAITVKTKLSGTVSISGAPKYDTQLTAEVNQVLPIAARDTLSYQWKRDGEDISGEMGVHYTPGANDLPTDDTTHSLTVVVTGADPYVGSVESAAVTVAKADGLALVAKPTHSDCTVDGINDGKITGLFKGRAYEYQMWALDGTAPALTDPWTPVEWPDGTEEEIPDEGVTYGTGEITGLAPGNYRVRRAETATHTAGPASETVTVLSAADSPNARAIAILPMEGGRVTASTRRALSGAKVTLTVTPADSHDFNDDLAVTGTSGAVDVTDNGDGTYTFTMPDEDVTVSASFTIKTYTITHDLKFVTCDLEDHNVTHGDTPAPITLTPQTGYELTGVNVAVYTKASVDADPNNPVRFAGYTYRLKDDGSGKGVITFNQPVTESLVVKGEAKLKTYQVYYQIYDLTALGQPREVQHGKALEVQLTHAANCALPESIDLYMGGELLVEDTQYSYANGLITIDENIITGDIIIDAMGDSTLPPLTGVTILGIPSQGQRLEAEVTPKNATVKYQWVRVVDGVPVEIEGATLPRYMLTEEDVDATIKVRVTGTGEYGGTIESEATETVDRAPVVDTTGVSLDRTSANVTVNGNVLQLNYTITPEDATNKMVRWSSDDETVATVDERGVVRGVAEGEATITVTTINGGHTATCKITVVGIKLSDLTVTVGSTGTIQASIPDDLSYQTLTWTSSDEEIATVDENGMVSGLKAGKVTITVTSDTGYSAECTLTVRARSTSSGNNNSSTTTTETKDDGTKVTTVTKPDGSTTTTTESPDGTKEVVEAKKDGTVTATTETPDGTVAVVETKPDGSKTQTVEQPDGTKSELAATKDGDVTITVTDPNGEELVKTEIPATIPEPETKFVDLAPTPWADEAIHKMAGLELVEGTGDNKYSPVASMTRGSLATVLHRLSQGKTDYEVTFQDVAETKFYAPSVAWAAKAGVVTGYTADTFAPEDIITREQLAVMLARYAKLIGMNTKADSAALAKFNDGANTGSWAVDGMAWCVENGIIRGKDGNRLDPTTDVSRAEVAVMLDRFIELLK